MARAVIGSVYRTPDGKTVEVMLRATGPDGMVGDAHLRWSWEKWKASEFETDPADLEPDSEAFVLAATR